MKPPFQVFLLGTPGCGKSEVYRRLSAKLVEEGVASEVLRIDDYPKVRDCFAADDAEERAGRTRRYSSRGLHRVRAPGMVRSIASNFDADVRATSLLLYIFCPFDICWERNVKRHQAALAAGIDDHLVSREEMERTYLNDDHARLQTLGLPFLVVDNHIDGDGILDYAIQEVVALLWAD